MLRKMIFKADMVMGKVARRAYKKAGSDTLVVRALDAVANAVCWFDLQIAGYEDLALEYVNTNR